MKKAYLLLLAGMLSTVTYADNNQTVKIEGSIIDKVVTEITFDGDDVILHYSDNSSDTKDMSLVAFSFTYGETAGLHHVENAKSRHARVRTMTVHMYNNYYLHCDVYGVGATSGSNIFMESNYFEAVKRPIMSSLQGTDIKGSKGTFSGENGGMIKSYGNVFVNKPSGFSYITYADNPSSYDAYEVAKPSDQLPASVKTLVGGTSYNNFDTNPDVMYSHTADNAVDVPSIIEGFYGAGRLNHGDIRFDIPDETVVTSGHQQPLPALANILDSYESGVVKVMGVE